MPEVPSALVCWPKGGGLAFPGFEETDFGAVENLRPEMQRQLEAERRVCLLYTGLGESRAKKGGRDEGFCRLRRMLTERP